MKRLCVFAIIACLGFGCAADGDKGQWDEFWKDLRGDNMKMRYGRPSSEGISDAQARTKADD
jgi:hypothetical protein